jgi:hypothetical protein
MRPQSGSRLLLGQKSSLIKDHMSRQINLISKEIKALIPSMTISKKKTWFGSIFKFVGGIGTKQKITLTSKHMKSVIIWFFTI